MSIISLRIPDQLLTEVNENAHLVHLSKTEYIRRAIESMNKHVKSHHKAKKLQALSLKVRKESMLINKEFDEIEYE